MYIRKEIKEFIKEMPIEKKLSKKQKNFIKECLASRNLLIEHGKEEYECTNCGKYSYGKLLSERNYKREDFCHFCGHKYAIKRSNLKNYFFLYNVAIIDNINKKIVIRYFEIVSTYNYRTRRFDSSIMEFARYVPEYEITLLNDKCPYGKSIYHYQKVKKWRAFGGKSHVHSVYEDIFFEDIDEKVKGTVYQYIPLYNIIDSLSNIGFKNVFKIFELTKYKSFELLIKAELYNLAFDYPEKFNQKGSFEKRFGVKREYYAFMKKHNISYEELFVLQLIQKPNMEIINRLLKMAYSNLNDLKTASRYVNLVELAEYSKTQYTFSIQSYLDYIENLEKIGIPLTRKKLFPKDFSNAHGLSIKKVKIVENKLLDEKIQQRYLQLEKNNYEDNKFFIRAAKTLKDMKDESKQQSNCVYSNYSEKYANGETDIYFLRKLKSPEKSLVTVEVSKGKIRQRYQKRNTSINKEQREFLNLWEENVLEVA